ncbi:MAG: rhomboid family intramembrane serine protease [Chthoniobacterales bacterium]
MSWLNKLDRIAAPIAVPGIIRYVAFLSSAAFVVGLAMPGTQALMPLERGAVFAGEWWRLLTFAFVPSSYGLFWIFALMFLFYMGDSLERSMGATRLTVFYLLGWLATVAATFLFGGIGSPIYINLAILLAFATYFPDSQISIYFIFPVKVKWVALVSLAIAIALARGLNGYATLALCLGNYLLFFGFDLVKSFHTTQQIAKRRHEFREKAKPDEETLHHCKVCGRTEISDPDLEFRVSADGEEYCTEHLPSRVS